MRVTSLVALVVVLAVAGYFIFLTPDWAVDLYLKATGYGPAATPTEAVDKFLKAVKARDFKTAARFCTSDYANQMKRGETAAKELGRTLDEIHLYMKNAGFATDLTVDYLHYLDPFPTNLSAGGPPKELDATKARGFVKMENIWPRNSLPQVWVPGSPPVVFQSLDRAMFNRAFMPATLLDPAGFEIVKDGSEWKLNFPMQKFQADLIEYYINNYKAYYTGLNVFRRGLTNERMDSKEKFRDELVSVIQKAK